MVSSFERALEFAAKYGETADVLADQDVGAKKQPAALEVAAEGDVTKIHAVAEETAGGPFFHDENLADAEISLAYYQAILNK